MVHYKGKQEDFLVFVDDVDTYKKWQSDKSVPLAHFISTFQVFQTHRYVFTTPLRNKIKKIEMYRRLT